MSKSLWSRSVWNSLFNRVSSSRRPARRRKALTKHFDTNVAAELLEQRIVPVVTVSFGAGVLTLTGEAGANEAVTVVAGSSFTDVRVNGVFTARVNQATSNSISTINFSGGASAADSLSISGTNQAITVGLTDVETLSLTSTRDAVVNADEALILGKSTVSGTLRLTTAAGGISQSSKVIVSGLTTLDAVTSIILNNSGNSFGTLELDGTVVSITEAGATDLGTTNATVLTVTSRGAITDSGVLTVTTGPTTLKSVGNAITLNDPNSTFAGDLVLSGTDIAVTDNSDVSLGKTTATGTLSITSSATDGDITGVGALKVGGLATFTTNGAGVVDLDNAALVNNFGSISVTTGSGNVLIREKSSTTLAGITTTGDLTVISNGAITDSEAVDVGAATLTTTGGAITIDEDGSQFAGNLTLTGRNISVTDNDGAGVILDAVTATGTFYLNSANGAVSDAGAIKVTGRATIDAGTGTITLNDAAATNFGSLALTAAGATIAEDSATDLFTSEIGAGGLVLTSAGAVTDSGDLAVIGDTDVTAGTGKNITLDSSGNEFTGAIITNGKRIVLTNTLATELGTTTATGVGTAGAFTLTSGGAVTQSGDITVPGRATITATGNNVDLSTNTNNFGSISVDGATVNITEDSSSDLFSVNATENFTLTANGAVTDSGTVTVGGNTFIDATGFAITLNSAASTFGGTVRLDGDSASLNDSDAGGVTFGGATVITNNLTINAGGDISDAGATVSAGTATLNAGSGGNITLANTTLTGATFSLTGEDADITTTGAVDFGTTTLTGLLDLTTTGAVSDSGNVVVAGTTTITAGAGNNITLNSLGNSFVGTITIVSGDDVTINNTSATDIGASTISGFLTVTSSGAVTDSGAVAVGEDVTVTATGSAITLNTLTMGTGFTLTTTGSDVLVTDTGDTELGVTTATGSFTLTTTGPVTQTGAATVGGAAQINTAGAVITLTQANNKFGSISVNNTGNNLVEITEKNSTVLAESSVGGGLTVISGSDVTDSGTLTVVGVLDVTANSNNADITLDSAASTFGSLVLKGVNVAVTEANNTQIDDIIANNTFSLSTTGNVSDAGAGDIVVAGVATINATGTITLGGAGATTNFGTIGLSGTTVSLDEDSSTNLGASTITVNFSLTSAGAVTDSGTVAVTGTTTIVATGFDITLDTADSVYTGALALDGKHIAVTTDSAAVLDDSTATGTFTITANGDISEVGGGAVLVITGTFTLDASSGANTITLVGTNDTFSTTPLILIVGVGGTVNYTP